MNRCLGLDVEWRRVSNSGPFVGLFLSLHGSTGRNTSSFCSRHTQVKEEREKISFKLFLNIKNVSVLYTL